LFRLSFLPLISPRASRLKSISSIVQDSGSTKQEIEDNRDNYPETGTRQAPQVVDLVERKAGPPHTVLVIVKIIFFHRAPP